MQVPTVTLEDLQAFQSKHFPTQQPSASPPKNDQAEDDDDLGYYPDGVKRTLTDEEIRIFRHSEIHALLRERQRQKEDAEYETRMQSSQNEESENLPDPAAEKRPLDTEPQAQGGDEKRSRSRRGSKKHITEETTSEPLDYGEESQTPKAEKPPVSQMPYQGRRIISYDD